MQTEATPSGWHFDFKHRAKKSAQPHRGNILIVVWHFDFRYSKKMCQPHRGDILVDFNWHFDLKYREKKYASPIGAAFYE